MNAAKWISVIHVYDVYLFSRDPYVIALRSVTLPTHPPTEGFNRGEVVCAGFTIYEVSKGVSKVRKNSPSWCSLCTSSLKCVTCFSFCPQISYYNQASPEVMPYISTDIAGLSSSFYSNFCACSQYLLDNIVSSPEFTPSTLWPAAAAGINSSWNVYAFKGARSNTFAAFYS